ncbi:MULTISPECIES: hypothetical protein [Moorena]|uniref:Uncharacterized protein n=1 Tax=Moorena producens (strain JHB) TaxID=1454205 RepID=A0A9Q9STW9_MOOP1|nr:MULTISPECIES: hypothetical protein [Moorena]NEQ11662.1 hypothetical protein [Moorena sp. SIO4E2]NEQ14492.1 hypothetical protein [Moorena sp. SIO3E2]NER90509.1 hypothetical protein [Moorena sp. SIO3A2]WAN69592.1 hypothetical protein BJP36_36495 [Moorena producens JHB]
MSVDSVDAIDLGQKATLREWSRGARCSVRAATRTHLRAGLYTQSLLSSFA